MQTDSLRIPTPALEPLSDAGLERARHAARAGGPDETARQFEQLFATLLVRELRRSMPKSPFGEGAGADVYEGWFDEHLGRELAQGDALGIARLIESGVARALDAAGLPAAGEEGAR